jgi:hypothetical protein
MGGPRRTPVGAFGLIVAEDALDRFLVKWIEARTTNRVARASLRLIFNPARTFLNAASNKLPWYRKDRSLSWRQGIDILNAWRSRWSRSQSRFWISRPW